MDVFTNYKLMINDLLFNDSINVIDVGAAAGPIKRFSEIKNVIFLCFEPEKLAYDELIKNKQVNHIIKNIAVSDKKEKRKFYIAKKRQLSSFYIPNTEFLSQFNEDELLRFSIVDSKIINCDTIDNINKILNVEWDYIKLDAQGHELPILNGSINTLSNTIAIEAEIEISQLYNNQCLFNEHHDFLTKNDFELFRIKPQRLVRFKDSDLNSPQLTKGQIFALDTLYLKTPETLIKNEENEKKLIKAFIMYIQLENVDLAYSIFHYASDLRIISNESLFKMKNILKLLQDNLEFFKQNNCISFY